MSNAFDRDKLATYYDDIEVCAYCGKSGADAFHHIFSRSGKYTDSILNAIPLHNYTCHINIHGKLMKREQQEKFIEWVAKRLHKAGYKLNDNDIKFIKEYQLEEIIAKII